MSNIKKPELLAPAGDLEKLKIAVLYGADAVYIGGEAYGLRAKAKNFDIDTMKEGIDFAHEHGAKVYITANIFAHNSDLRAKAKNFDIDTMKEGIDFAHEHGAKVYITANIFAHNSDFDGMDEYFKKIYEIGADAVLVSDPGVYMTLKEAAPDMELHISTQANNTNYKTANFWYNMGIGADAVLVSDPGVYMTLKEAAPDMELHISTQANNTNYKTANFWYNMGAKRIVGARELSLKEIKEMRSKIPDDMEIETFVHGAMCISYSGRCLLSNYLSGRDANKGACSHPCRWKYYLMEETRPGEYMPVEENERGTYIFNSKDLCMLNHIPELIDAGISSLKIEGRMKTPYYVGTVVKAYRQAIDDYFKDPEYYKSRIDYYMSEITKASHRDFTTGFYFGKPGHDDQVYTNNDYFKDPEYYKSRIDYYMSEITKASHRDFTTGFYFGKPGHDDQVYTNNSYIRDYDFIGIVTEDRDDESGCAVIMQRNKFEVGDKIEILPVSGDSMEMTVTQMWNEEGISVQSAPHPEQILKLKTELPLKKFDMLRKASKQ